MNKRQIVEKLTIEYPGKNIICLPEENPQEIICEVDPTPIHPKYNIAIAVIDKSMPHYHLKVKETYKVLEGELTLVIDDTSHVLKKGESFVVEPGQVHYAIGDSTWIECKSEPGWTAEDHILDKGNQ